MKYLLPLFALLMLACTSPAFAQPGDPEINEEDLKQVKKEIIQGL